MQKATLRLFNALQVETAAEDKVSPVLQHSPVLSQTVPNGYILDPRIDGTDSLLKTIESVIGISGEKANNSFHKSWKIIQNSPDEILVTQQILHYFTTYGFEQKNMYHEETVYLPHEILELPSIKEDIPLTVIQALSSGEILEQIITLASGIALAQTTLNDIMTIIRANSYDSSLIDQISNRELKGLLYDYYDIVPQKPVEYLRYVIAKITDESLLIKNSYLIEKIKSSNGKFLDLLLKDAPEDLASIFYRYKPLFLAMKSISRNKNFFNRLRKKAVKEHKPLPEDYLNSITRQIKENRLDLDLFTRKISEAAIFRKIRLAYALKFRADAGDSIVYRIRNSTAWATDFQWSPDHLEVLEQALQIVIDSITADISINVEGKQFYIPSNIHYTLPATEKQFTGFLPTGTYISVPEDMIVGIHWENTERRIDLDLSVIGKTGKIGWDSDYKSNDQTVLFSGDMTDAPAPLGATELFYIRNGAPESCILFVNYFNYSKEDPVPAKIIAAHERPKNFKANYMVDINKIVASAAVEVSRKQSILGFITNIDNENRLYFANISLGNSISSNNEYTTQVRTYFEKSLLNSIELNQILLKAGAEILDKPAKDVISLAPEALTKNSFLNILLKQKDN